MDSIIIKEERLNGTEYIDFLKRTDLGSQYPKERFYERIEKLVKNAFFNDKKYKKTIDELGIL